MDADEFLNPPSLDNAITLIEMQIVISSEYYPEDRDYVAGLERALRILRSTRAADEIRAQWSFSPAASAGHLRSEAES